MIEEPEIFKVAASLPAEERASYLDAACSEQPGARERVEELLRHHDAVGFMEVGAIASPSSGSEAELARSRPEAPGDRLGHYTLVEQIGEGGFGTVWVADQDMPVRRRVALKIIKLGMDTKEVVARFEQERQALAMMDHSNIAKVLDAGATPTGRPFFVLELVRGIKITTYCDQENLPTAKRLELFIAVCNAVQHAHQKGIIHRDLKPSNILVTLHDGVPVPKVIDFGVAKATQQQRLTDLTIYTELDQMIGTPLYMSPEQAEMSGLDVDTRSDIYSLGVLLYELLTGRTPFDPEKLRQAGIDEVRRIIREQEPQTPSMFLKTMAGETRITVAQRRRSDPENLTRMVRGDLDWIVMKALEKDRTRRYEAANSLAADIQRHLNSEPVLARPASTAYRFRRMVKRNKVGFAAAATVLLALVIGLVIATNSYFRERDARTEMKHQRDKAQLAAAAEKDAKEESQKRLAQLGRTNKILTSIFAKLDPRSEKRGDKPLGAKLGKLVSEAADLLEGEATGDPIDVANMQVRLAQSLTNLGFEEKAIAILTKAFRTLQDSLGERHRDTLFCMSQLSTAYWKAHDMPRALSLAEKTLPLTVESLGPEDPATLEAANDLAALYCELRRYAEAVPLLEKTLEQMKKGPGRDHINTLSAMNNLASAYQDSGKMELALALYNETLQLCEKVLGPDHADTLGTMQNLAEAYHSNGQLELAIPMYEKALELMRSGIGPAHPDTLMTIRNLASAYADDGKSIRGVMLLERIVPVYQEKLGRDNSETLATMFELATFRWTSGKVNDAVPLFEEVLNLRKATLGEDAPETIISMNILALACEDAGNREKAVPHFKEGLRRYQSKTGTETGTYLGHKLAGVYGRFLIKREVDRLPQDPEILADIASILSEDGKAEKAIVLAKRALELQPGNEEAAKVLEAAKAAKEAPAK